MTINGDDGPSFFARYIDDPEKERLEFEKIRTGKNTEKLRDWLVNHWTKPTVTVREIRIYGPNLIRDGKAALSTAESLVEQGWLVPLKTRRRDMREWQIVPKTSKPLFLKLAHQQQQP
jgi:hypothetical protein